MRLRQSYARNCFYLLRLLQRNSINAFVFIASCMGSSKSKFQLSNADVYRNAGRVVTQKCMVSDNLNTIGHTWSLFRFFTASLLFNFTIAFILLSAPLPPKNDWNPTPQIFVFALWKMNEIRRVHLLSAPLQNFYFVGFFENNIRTLYYKTCLLLVRSGRGGLQRKMKRPLGVRGQESGCLPFSLRSSLFPLETPYTWLNYFFFHHHLEWGVLTYLPDSLKQACDKSNLDQTPNFSWDKPNSNLGRP